MCNRRDNYGKSIAGDVPFFFAGSRDYHRRLNIAKWPQHLIRDGIEWQFPPLLHRRIPVSIHFPLEIVNVETRVLELSERKIEETKFTKIFIYIYIHIYLSLDTGRTNPVIIRVNRYPADNCELYFDLGLKFKI